MGKSKYCDFEMLYLLAWGGEGDVFLARDKINKVSKLVKVLRDSSNLSENEKFRDIKTVLRL